MEASSSQKEFRLIYEEHYSHLCSAAHRILRDKESAREVVQEIFADLWSKRNWHQIKSLKAYLYVAAYNRSITQLDKRKRFVSEDHLINKSVGGAQPMENEELRLIILNAIHALPDQCKKIFLLSREEEMTYEEIAIHLNLSVKTIERQMGIALKKLRAYLEIHWLKDGSSFDLKILLSFI